MVTAGIGAALLLPRSAHAVEVADNDVEIKTPDGVCDAYFVTPTAGAHAAVIVWPDIFGLRPAFRQMGKRLAESGYSVLVVNPFYRSKKAPVALNASSTPIQDVAPLARALSEKTHTDDAKAFVAWLDEQPQNRTQKRSVRSDTAWAVDCHANGCGSTERIGAGATVSRRWTRHSKAG